MQSFKRFMIASPLCASLLVAATPAMAQTTTYVPEDEIKQNEAEATLGAGRLDGTLGLTASFSLASNQNVVGQVDGFSTLVGLGIVGGLDYLYGKYEMRNTVKLNESFARTPVVPEFLKTNDVLAVENLHNYFLINWAGVFGRLSVQTNIFDTEDVRTDENDYIIPGDTPETLATNAERFKLNGPLSPLTFNESIGVFAEPVRKKPVNLSIRLGGGGRQTLADGVLVLDDDADTEGVIELKRLDNVIQAGAEGFIGARGTLKGGRMTYDVGVSAMVPFLNNDDQNRSAAELTRVAAEANLTFGVFEWLNLVYSSKAINDPQLLDDWQLQNNLLLTFQYTLIERNTATPTSPSELDKAKRLAAEAEKKAAEADKKAAEAEAKAAEAEAKAAEAEAKAKAAEEALKKQAEETTTEEKPATEGGDTTTEEAPAPEAP